MQEGLDLGFRMDSGFRVEDLGTKSCTAATTRDKGYVTSSAFQGCVTEACPRGPSRKGVSTHLRIHI